VSETYGIPIAEPVPQPQALPAQTPAIQNIVTFQNAVSDAYAEFARLIPMLYELAKANRLTLDTLDMVIYYTYVDIVKGIIEAYERDYSISVAYNTLEPRIAKHFKVNIYKFSNAKSFQQLLDINKAVLDAAGEFVTFEDFKQKVATINATYNERWLKTEYEFAKAAGQMAIQWEDIQETKDALPLLKYTSVKDRLVRPAHRILDNIVRPVDDEFWLRFYPPNGWNCRCTVKQVQKATITPDDVLAQKIQAADIPTEFQFNPAISKVVFNPQLPIFDVPSNVSATIQSRIQEFKNFKDPDIF
jgi:SPP1 gp7 family putative phage head morphogenesis protein